MNLFIYELIYIILWLLGFCCCLFDISISFLKISLWCFAIVVIVCVCVCVCVCLVVVVVVWGGLWDEGFFQSKKNYISLGQNYIHFTTDNYLDV